MSRIRTRRIAKWTGLATSVVWLVAWGISLRWHIAYIPRSKLYALVLDGGTVCCKHVTAPAAIGSSGEYGFYAGSASQRELGFILPSIRTFRGRGVHFTRTQIPIWLPLAITALLTAFLFWRDRRHPPGHCQRCGYDLTGNVTGVCSECEEPISTEKT